MKRLGKVVTIISVLSALSLHAARGQERANHPSEQDAVPSSVDVYERWRSQATAEHGGAPSSHHCVAVVTKRLGAQTASVDLAVAASDSATHRGPSKFAVEFQSFKYSIEPNGDFSRQSLGERTRLDLPAVGHLRRSDGRVLSNPNLTFPAHEQANGVEVAVRFIGGQEESSITILMPLTSDARSGAGGQVSGGVLARGHNPAGRVGPAIRKVLFEPGSTPWVDECLSWTLSCGGTGCTNKTWRCSNKNPEFNCVTCTVSNCTECEAT